MRIAPIVSGIVAVAAIGGLTIAFVGNASPYVTIQDAKSQPRRVHVVGKITPKTIARNLMQREVRFQIEDETGKMPVRYVGPPQSNLESATQVVVIGAHAGGTFTADQMLVKCPSKYESEPTASRDPRGT